VDAAMADEFGAHSVLDIGREFVFVASRGA
jgi:hypothetical protein